jgi:hypothetical protein
MVDMAGDSRTWPTGERGSEPNAPFHRRRLSLLTAVSAARGG